MTVLPVPVNLNSNPLPWVSSGKYLGNKMSGVLDGYQNDAKEKRAQYIGKNVDLNQEFCPAHPAVKSRINQIYNSSFYGSILWNLNGENTRQVINSWSVSVRHMWNLPHNTHRRFIEPLGGKHAQVKIYSNYIRFIQSVQKCKKMAMKYLLVKSYKDMNTMTGQNSRHIMDRIEENDILKVKPDEFKRKFKFEELPVDEHWKVDIIKSLTDIKHGKSVLTKPNVDETEEVEFPAENEEEVEFTPEELDEILYYVCTS